MTTTGPDGREHRGDDDHDQDSDPPTPFGEEPTVPDQDTDEPGAHPDPEPGGGG
ncbi:hypothetical protein [Nocardioides sp. URHA0020]|uniref:hypothetical protein n=1 Tax=Nocardioides sp. URHA0020 TaxID=1380392 RepID=UPI000A591584|nr:hypothetical protein [Nocardioides sp. URHA0020]